MDEPIWTSRNRRPIVLGAEGVPLVALLARIRARVDRERAERAAVVQQAEVMEAPSDERLDD